MKVRAFANDVVRDVLCVAGLYIMIKLFTIKLLLALVGVVVGMQLLKSDKVRAWVRKLTTKTVEAGRKTVSSTQSDVKPDWKTA